MVNLKFSIVPFPRHILATVEGELWITSKRGGLKLTKNQIDWFNAQTSRMSALRQAELNEKVAAETNRHNIATESETLRANLAKEDANVKQVAINDFIARETNRANVEREKENVRHNLSSESIQSVSAGAASAQASAALQNASTNEYNATTAVNNMLLSSRKGEQDIKESKAREKYYTTQANLGITAKSARDATGALADLVRTGIQIFELTR